MKPRTKLWHVWLESHRAKPPAETIGIKHDDNKLQWRLLPIEPIEDIIRVLMFGAKKYAPNNWQKIETVRYYDAAMRHLTAWRQGEHLDPESKLPHLAHAGCCLLFMAWLERNKK